MRIISRLDIKMGTLIKSVMYDGVRKIGDPAEYANDYVESSVDELMLINNTGSLYNTKLDLNLIKEIRKFGSGYIFDRIFRRREFHHPINFIPIELQYGFSTNISKNYLFSYESDVKGYEGTLLGHQLDVDIMKTNLAYYLFRNSWLDMHSGLNLRYASLLLPSKIPEEWNASQNSWLLDAKFKGTVMELAWSQSLILQWFESWYTTYRYTYGIASSKFYKDQNTLGL